MNILPKLATIVFAISLVSSPATSHGGADGATLVRMDAMTEIQTTLKKLKSALSPAAFSQTDVEAAFEDLRTFGSALPALFDENHMPHVSEASPTIWQNKKDFAAEIEIFNSSVEAAAGKVVGTPQQVLRIIGKGCQSCHTNFRVKKN